MLPAGEIGQAQRDPDGVFRAADDDLAPHLLDACRQRRDGAQARTTEVVDAGQIDDDCRGVIASGALEAVSNTETGFRPIALGGDELIVFRFTGQGLVPARITGTPITDAAAITFLGERLAEEKPVVRSWMAGAPGAIDWDAMPKTEGVYRLAGFAVVENFGFLQAMADAPVTLWVVRGLGTATLHGVATAIAAVIAKGFQDQRRLALPPGGRVRARAGRSGGPACSRSSRCR